MLKELRAKITADASRFKSACDESIAKTKALAKAMAEKATGARASERMVQQALERSERQMDKATAAAKRAKAAGGGGGSIGAMAVFQGAFAAQAAMAAIRKGADYIAGLVKGMDEIGKGAANLGTSTEYFQKLQFAAERTGTGFEKVFQGFSKTKKLAADAASGNAQATQTFHDLGISVSEIKTLSPEALFDRVTGALRSMDDPLQRDAISSRLFGEEFAKLNNFMKDYQSLGQEAAAKGLIIKDEEIKAAEALQDSITNLQKSLTSLAGSTGLVSFLSRVADGVADIDKGLRALKNNPKAMQEAGITEKDNRNWFQKGYVRSLNYSGAGALFMGARRLLGKDAKLDRGFGDYVWDKFNPDKPQTELTTAPVTRDDMAKQRKKLQQQREEEAAKKAQEEENKRALAREKSAAEDQKLQQGLQQLQASRQQPGSGSGASSTRATQMLRSEDGIAKLRRMGKDHYMDTTGEMLPPGAASQLQYIRTGLQLFDQMEQAQQRRAQTHKRISDAIAQQGASDEQRERMQLKRELDEFAAAGASKEALARLYATRIADITRKAQDRRHAQEMAQLRAENNRLIQQIDQRNKALQARLSGFKFSLDEGFDPNESAKSRRNRAKQQKLDESIAQKKERQQRGENVHYSRAELRRIEEYERIRRRMGKNEQRMVALREEPEALQQRQQQRRQQPAPAPRQRQADRPQQPTRPATPARPATPQQRQWQQQPRQPRLIIEAPQPAPVAVPVAAVPEQTVPVAQPAPVAVPVAAVPEQTVPVAQPAPVAVPVAAVPEQTVPVAQPAPVAVPVAAVPEQTVPVAQPAPVAVPVAAVPEQTVPVAQPAPVAVPVAAVPEQTVPVAQPAPVAVPVAAVPEQTVPVAPVTPQQVPVEPPQTVAVPVAPVPAQQVPVAAVPEQTVPVAPVTPQQVPVEPPQTVAVPVAPVPAQQVPVAAVPEQTVPVAPVTPQQVPVEPPQTVAVPVAAVPEQTVPVAQPAPVAVPVAAVPEQTVPVAPVTPQQVPVEPPQTVAVPVAPVPAQQVPVAAVPEQTVPVAPVTPQQVPVEPPQTVAVPVAPVPAQQVPVAAVPEQTVPVAPVTPQQVPVEPPQTVAVPVAPVPAQQVPVAAVPEQTVPVAPVTPQQVPVEPPQTVAVPVAAVPAQQVPVSPIPPINIPGMMGAMGAINQTAYMPVLTQIASAVYKLGQHTYVVRGG